MYLKKNHLNKIEKFYEKFINIKMLQNIYFLDEVWSPPMGPSSNLQPEVPLDLA